MKYINDAWTKSVTETTTLTPEQFYLQYPDIETLSIGHINHKNQKLSEIQSFMICPGWIYQTNRYEADNTNSYLISFEQIVSFSAEPTLHEIILKEEQYYEISKKMIEDFMIGDKIVINPDNFEPFDVDSNDFKKYINNAKTNLENRRIKIENMKKELINV